jgi:hypothetical protein
MRWHYQNGVHLLFVAVAVVFFAAPVRAQRRPDIWDKVGQQETHIEASDKEIQRLLIRIEGDEDFLKGALGVIGFMQSLGLIKSFQRKQA